MTKNIIDGHLSDYTKYDIRIIVSGMHSPTTALETNVKNVSTKAQPFPTSHIKDSCQFKNKIKYSYP